jgi:hypothetical protein
MLGQFSTWPTLEPRRLEAFRSGLRFYEVRAILIRPLKNNNARIEELLREEGFELVQREEFVDLWVSNPELEVGPG